MNFERFTFNSSIGGDGNGSNYFSLNENIKLKTKENIVYQKTFSIKFDKTIKIIQKRLGLGDIIDFITKYTGIKYVIIKITKGNCGCEQRRKKFNNWLQIPYLSIIIEDAYADDITINNIWFKLKKIFKKKNKQIVKPVKTANVSVGEKKPCGCQAKKQNQMQSK